MDPARATAFLMLLSSLLLLAAIINYLSIIYEIEMDSINVIHNIPFTAGVLTTSLWNHLLLLCDVRHFDESSSSSNPIIYDMQQQQQLLFTPNTCKNTSLITHEVHEAYRKDGVVAIRNLIPSDVLHRLREAGDELVHVAAAAYNNNAPSRRRFFMNNSRSALDLQRHQQHVRSSNQFHTVKSGVIFEENKAAAHGDASHAFQDVALHSLIPYVAAELLLGVGVASKEKNDNNSGDTSNADLLEINGHGRSSIRLLRDIFLAKDEGEYVCGWHVDDYGFWPATPASDGINAWIALDDMALDIGGGFAVYPGSHKALWRHAGYRAIGATPTFPPQGFYSAGDMFENRVGHGTCNLEDAAPEIHRKLERGKRVYDVRAGDVLFMNRWVWHKTIPFNTSDIVDHTFNNDTDSPTIFKRYSIRYAPGSAISPKGVGTEPSILWNGENAGKTLDEISSNEDPWYPRVFPSVDPDEIELLSNFMEGKSQTIENRLKQRKREMQPFLSSLQKRKRLKTTM